MEAVELPEEASVAAMVAVEEAVEEACAAVVVSAAVVLAPHVEGVSRIGSISRSMANHAQSSGCFLLAQAFCFTFHALPSTSPSPFLHSSLPMLIAVSSWRLWR